MPLRIFQNKTLAGANAVGVLLGGSFFAYIFIGTLYMQQVLGYSALKAGSPGWRWRSSRSPSPACRRRWSPAAGQARDGGRNGHDRRRHLVVNPGARARALLGQPGRAVLHRRESAPRLPSSRSRSPPWPGSPSTRPACLRAHQHLQQLGGAIGVAIASTIAATHASTLLHQGAAPAAALTSGFHGRSGPAAHRPGRGPGDLTSWSAATS
jgi:hypothetical protein